jgi:hypothetical protein
MIEFFLMISFSFMVLAIALKLLRGEEVGTKIMLLLIAMSLAFFLFPLIIMLVFLLAFYFLLKFLEEIWRELNE